MAASLSGINAIASNFIQCKQSQAGMSKFIVRSSLGTSFDSRKNEVNPSDNEKLHVSRRASFGMGAIALFSQLQLGPARAEDPPTFNGWWLTGPIPAPVVTSQIMNAETGTRSFLQKGIYLGADIGPEVNAYKLKQCAFDLLSMKDLIYQGDVWPYIRRYLCLKSTIMYYNFDKFISGVADDEKSALTDLANRLFDNAEVVITVLYYALLIFARISADDAKFNRYQPDMYCPENLKICYTMTKMICHAYFGCSSSNPGSNFLASIQSQ